MDRATNTISIADMSGYHVPSTFVSLIDKGRQRGYCEFFLDFSGVEFTYPNACVPLCGLIDSYYQGQQIDLVLSCGLPQVLNNISFFDPPLATNKGIAQHKKALNRIWKFREPVEVQRLVDAFVIEAASSLEFKGDGLKCMEWCLCEAMYNVIQHSKTQLGYVMGQIQKNGLIAFCVFDAGQGIYNSFNITNYKPTSHLDAIYLALTEGVSRDNAIGPGNGLWGLSQIVSKNEGYLAITSGSSRYVRTDNHSENNMVFPHPLRHGTTIDFMLDPSKPVSVSEALGRSPKPLSFFLERFVDNCGHFSYLVADNARGTGTRDSAQRARIQLVNLVESEQQHIRIDFNGVVDMSPSFADELVGKLVARYGFAEFSRIFRLYGLNSNVREIVYKTISERAQEAMCGN